MNIKVIKAVIFKPTKAYPFQKLRLIVDLPSWNKDSATWFDADLPINTAEEYLRTNLPDVPYEKI